MKSKPFYNKPKDLNGVFLVLICPETQVYLQPCEISKMKLFAKIVNDFQPLVIFEKNSMLDADRALNTPLRKNQLIILIFSNQMYFLQRKKLKFLLWLVVVTLTGITSFDQNDRRISYFE